MKTPAVNDLSRRIGIGVEISWSYNPADHGTFRKWLFDGEVEIKRESRGKPIFWPHAWIRVCGLLIGAGLSYAPKQMCD